MGEKMPILVGVFWQWTEIKQKGKRNAHVFHATCDDWTLTEWKIFIIQEIEK